MSISEYVNFVGSFFLGGGGVCVCCGCGVGEGYCEMKVVWRDGGVDVMGTGWPRRAARTGGRRGGWSWRCRLGVAVVVMEVRDSQDRTRPGIRTWAVASHDGRSLYMLDGVSGCREEYRAVPEGSGSGDSASETQHGAAYQGAVHQQGSIAAV